MSYNIWQFKSHGRIEDEIRFRSRVRGRATSFKSKILIKVWCILLGKTFWNCYNSPEGNTPQKFRWIFFLVTPRPRRLRDAWQVQWSGLETDAVTTNCHEQIERVYISWLINSCRHCPVASCVLIMRLEVCYITVYESNEGLRCNEVCKMALHCPRFTKYRDEIPLKLHKYYKHFTVKQIVSTFLEFLL